MSEATSDSHTRKRSHHGTTGRDNNRRPPPPASEQQRRERSETQKAYVAADPRWPAHRRKLAEAQIARRMTLSPEEIAMVLEMRARAGVFATVGRS
jgi:hypothetical protein